MALHRHVSGPRGQAKLGMRPQSEFALPAEVGKVPRLSLGPLGLPANRLHARGSRPEGACHPGVPAGLQEVSERCPRQHRPRAPAADL